MPLNKAGKTVFSMDLDRKRTNRITILSRKYLVKRVSTQRFLSFFNLDIHPTRSHTIYDNPFKEFKL